MTHECDQYLHFTNTSNNHLESHNQKLKNFTLKSSSSLPELFENVLFHLNSGVNSNSVIIIFSCPNHYIIVILLYNVNSEQLSIVILLLLLSTSKKRVNEPDCVVLITIEDQKCTAQIYFS